VWSKFRLGSNVMSGAPVTRTSVTVSGIRLFDASLGADDSLAVGADLYDEHGRMLGSFTANTRRRTAPAVYLRAEKRHVVVRTTADATVLLDVALVDTQLIVSAMRLGTRGGRFCVLDPTGGLTLRHRAGIGNPEYHTGDIATMPLNQIDLATTFASVRPSPVSRRFG
jgi:hypothetical protein